jgi:hypothetical protein
MPLTKTDTDNPIRGKAVPTKSQRLDCQKVINALIFADLGRKAGTLHTSGDVRLDMQGRTAQGDANLQVQIGNGTAAAALIANSVQKEKDPINQKGVIKGCISVLQQSLDSGTIWNLTGSIP